MVQLSHLVRRLPVGLLIALAVTATLGSAFAVSEGVQGDATPSSLTIPAPRLGDHGAYRVSIKGDWDRQDIANSNLSQAPYREPWTALEFAWADAGQGRDASGATGPADQLNVVGRFGDLDILKQDYWNL